MAIQSFACFHIDFLLPMSSAAAYLTLRRCLLSKILTSLDLICIIHENVGMIVANDNQELYS